MVSLGWICLYEVAKWLLQRAFRLLKDLVYLKGERDEATALPPLTTRPAVVELHVVADSGLTGQPHLRSVSQNTCSIWMSDVETSGMQGQIAGAFGSQR